MKKIILSTLLGMGLFALPMAAQEPSTDKAAGEFDKSGKRIVKGAKKSGTAMKHGEVVASGKEAGKATGTAVKHAAKGTAEGARVVGDKTEDVADKSGRATVKGAKKVGDKAEDVWDKTSRETVKGAKKTGRVVKDALDGHDEKQK
ncbi:MAG: hypothetical protein SGI92_18535 [Bryobacteraceae bacterium]|nr:hypothetical protein [Bryobacteraceae bacterium]